MKKLLLLIAGAAMVVSCANNNFTPASEVNTGTYQLTSNNFRTNSVFFAENSSDISTAYVKVLKENASYLRLYRNATVLLAGNSSEPGGEKYNKALALERAENVKVVLMRLGVNANQISIASNGKDELEYHKPDKEVLLKDQRVDILYQTKPPFGYKVDKLPIIDADTLF